MLSRSGAPESNQSRKLRRIMVEAKTSIFPLAIAENAHTIRKRYGATEDSFVSPGALGWCALV